MSLQLANESGTAIVRIRRDGVMPVEGCLLALPVAAIGYVRWLLVRQRGWVVEEYLIGQRGSWTRPGRSDVFATRAEAEERFDAWLDE